MSFLPHTTYNKNEKIWSGQKEAVPMWNTNYSVGKLLFNMMSLRKKSVAFICDSENRSCTYQELLLGATRIAENLKNMEIKFDSVVGIVARPTFLSSHVIMACFFNANPFHPINAAQETAVIQHLYSITRPKVIFCEGNQYDRIRRVCKDLKLDAAIYTLNEHLEGVPQVENLMKPSATEMFYRPLELKHGGDQTSCILNSSGTSGLPKAVCMSNHVLLLDMSFVEPDDVTFNFSPLDWFSAIFFTITAALVGAKHIITTKPFSPEYLMEVVDKYKVTCLMLSPSLCACMVSMKGIEKRDLSHLTKVAVGGGIMPPNIFTKMRELLKDPHRQLLSNGYGSTEIAIGVSVNLNANKPSAVGQIIHGVKVKIVNDDGKQLGVGETGEILVHTTRSWNGYYGNPIESSKMRDVNNWYHTGDLGYFDEDGDLFIVDRKKDIMKYRGVHYSPHEIEDVISAMPDVVEVCVFGNTNDTEGDRAAAAIVKRSGSKLTENEVVDYVASKIDVLWKRLHGGVFFMDQLPKTGSGKVIRKDTKKFALGNIEH